VTESQLVTHVGNIPALKQFIALGGRKVCFIVPASQGLFRFVEETEVIEPDAPAVPAYWYWDESYCSGLYESPEAAEKEAFCTLSWLHDFKGHDT